MDPALNMTSGSHDRSGTSHRVKRYYAEDTIPVLASAALGTDQLVSCEGSKWDSPCAKVDLQSLDARILDQAAPQPNCAFDDNSSKHNRYRRNSTVIKVRNEQILAHSGYVHLDDLVVR